MPLDIGSRNRWIPRFLPTHGKTSSINRKVTLYPVHNLCGILVQLAVVKIQLLFKLRIRFPLIPALFEVGPFKVKDVMGLQDFGINYVQFLVMA